MSRVDSVSFELVELVPSVLADGVIYISHEHGVMVHKCCCGCGERVVNSLGPAQWTATIRGDSLSVSPSIGTGAQACNSHYWICDNKIKWAVPLTAAQRQRSQLADRRDVLRDQLARELAAVPRWRLIKRWRLRRRIAKEFAG